MKHARFYLEFPDVRAKERSGKENKGHSGNVVAVFDAFGDGFVVRHDGCLDSMSGIFEYPNSPVGSGGVSVHHYLQPQCKRVSERLARVIHPMLFERLDEDEGE